jgi:hypothetical protein
MKKNEYVRLKVVSIIIGAVVVLLSALVLVESNPNPADVVVEMVSMSVTAIEPEIPGQKKETEYEIEIQVTAASDIWIQDSVAEMQFPKPSTGFIYRIVGTEFYEASEAFISDDTVDSSQRINGLFKVKGKSSERFTVRVQIIPDKHGIFALCLQEVQYAIAGNKKLYSVALPALKFETKRQSIN